MFSLMVTGTPSSGESARPARQRASEAAAAGSAASRWTRYMALMRGSQAAMRSSSARATCTGESSPLAYAAESCAALRSWIAAMTARLYTRRHMLLRSVFLLLFFAGTATAADILLWHSMNGARGADFERIVARFNASQKEFRVVPTYKGQYDEAAVEAVTARRTARAPHIVQASELGGAYLLEQRDLVRPLWQVLERPDAGFGAEELRDADGRLVALPLGRSTPVLYYNRDAFRVAMLDPSKPPATWYEMVPVLAALVGAGSDCALTMAWPASALLENMAAWHNQAF